MPRDALWVMPNGVTKVVTLDDDGNLIEEAPTGSFLLDAVAPLPIGPDGKQMVYHLATDSVREAKEPDPPQPKRGRRNRR